MQSIATKQSPQNCAANRMQKSYDDVSKQILEHAIGRIPEIGRNKVLNASDENVKHELNSTRQLKNSHS